MGKFKDIVENDGKIDEKVLEEMWHPKDDVLDGITYEQLIVSLHAGEPVIDEKAVKRVFEYMLDNHIEDARYMLKKHMKDIIKEARIGRESY